MTISAKGKKAPPPKPKPKRVPIKEEKRHKPPRKPSKN